ncbi:MAG: zinc dependent phospholipase C family protein [Candidatus Woesearchaeota archaeon]
MLEKAHIIVLNAALNIVKDKEMEEYKECLIKGVLSPDKHFKAVHHFYNPDAKRGLRPFGNAKERGVKSFKKALETYNKEKNKSYTLLGNSLHYLADLAVPSHSKLIVHLFNTDDLEIYLEKVIGKIKIGKRIIKRKRIEDYFVEVARLSSKLNTEKNSTIISLKFKMTKQKKVLPEKELKKQSAKITNVAVAYSAGLMKSFIESKNKSVASKGAKN